MNKGFGQSSVPRGEAPHKVQREPRPVPKKQRNRRGQDRASLTPHRAYHSLHSEAAEYGEIGGRSGLDQPLRRPVEDTIAQVRGAKVLQVCQPADGGVAHQVAILTHEMRDRGLSVAVACSPGALSEMLRESGIEVHELPLVRQVSPRKDLSAVRTLLKIVRR